MPTRKARTPEPVKVTRRGINYLDPSVRAEAMRLANGDAQRVEVVSRTECVVR